MNTYVNTYVENTKVITWEVKGDEWERERARAREREIHRVRERERERERERKREAVKEHCTCVPLEYVHGMWRYIDAKHVCCVAVVGAWLMCG